jgi:hypothetical protein
MKGFKDTTRTTSGFKHWNGGSIGGSGTGGTINRLAQGGSVGGTNAKIGDRMHGNSATQRSNPPTRELEDHGGKTPLTAGFAAGGDTLSLPGTARRGLAKQAGAGQSKARHFHVHHHHYEKGGGVKTHTKSYETRAARAVESQRSEPSPGVAMPAQALLGEAKLGKARHSMGGHTDASHVHDCTQVPAGGPDYAKGGKTKIHIKPKNRGALHRDMGVPQGQKIPKNKIRAKLAHDKAAGNAKGVKRDVFALNFGKGHAEGGKVGMNAGGAMYAPGGPVAPPMMGGGAQPPGALAQLAARPRGFPMRPALPMHRPVAMPGPQPIMRAAGGTVPMRKVAQEEIRKHVAYPTPRGHKGLGEALKGRGVR